MTGSSTNLPPLIGMDGFSKQPEPYAPITSKRESKDMIKAYG